MTDNAFKNHFQSISSQVTKQRRTILQTLNDILFVISKVLGHRCFIVMVTFEKQEGVRQVALTPFKATSFY